MLERVSADGRISQTGAINSQTLKILWQKNS